MAKSAPNKTAKGRGKLPKPTRRPSPSAFQDAAEKLNAMNQAPGQTSGRPRASSSDALLVGVNGNASLAPDRTFLEYASAAPQFPVLNTSSMSPRQVSGEGKNRIESAVHDQATNGILSPSRDRDDLATPYTASRIESNVATPTGKKASHSSSGKPNAEKSHTTANRRFRLVSLSPDDDENGNDVSTARSGVAVPNRRAPESNRSRSRIDDLDGFIISDTEDDPEDIYDGPLVKKPNRRVSLRGAVHDKLDLDIDMVDWQDSNKSSTSKRSNCRRTTSRTPRSIKKPRSRLQEEIDDLDIEMVGWSDKAKSSTSKNTPTKLRSADRTSTKASRSTRASSSLNDDDLFANDHTSDNDSSNKNSRYLMSGALPNERARSAHNVQYVTEFTPDYDPELDSERHIPVPTIEPLISPS